MNPAIKLILILILTSTFSNESENSAYKKSPKLQIIFFFLTDVSELELGPMISQWRETGSRWQHLSVQSQLMSRSELMMQLQGCHDHFQGPVRINLVLGQINLSIEKTKERQRKKRFPLSFSLNQEQFESIRSMQSPDATQPSARCETVATSRHRLTFSDSRRRCYR